MKSDSTIGRGCGAVDRAVPSNTRDPTLSITVVFLEKTKKYMEEAN